MAILPLLTAVLPKVFCRVNKLDELFATVVLTAVLRVTPPKLVEEVTVPMVTGPAPAATVKPPDPISNVLDELVRVDDL
jgi:hypothetical protein